MSSYKPKFHPPRSLNFTATLAGDGFRKKETFAELNFTEHAGTDDAAKCISDPPSRDVPGMLKLPRRGGGGGGLWLMLELY